MPVVESFTLDHTKVKAPYVRVAGYERHRLGSVVQKFDLRFLQPNVDAIPTAALHTLEHLLAFGLREELEGVIDISPMGCRTGFYLLLSGDYESKDIVPLMTELFEFIRDFEGDVPGAAARDCGNYLDMNLGMAKYIAGKYLDQVLYGIDEKHLVYPED